MAYTNYESTFSPPGGSSDTGSLGASGQADKKLQEFLQMEQQKAQFQQQINEMTDVCWEKCVGYPSAKTDGKTELCLQNCVERFIDVSLLIGTKLQDSLSKLQQ